MAYFDWNDNLSVGVDLFDSHHKKLIDLINELHEAMASGKGMDKVKSTVTELARYTKYHFAEEERQMKAANYSGLSAQIKEHAAFVAQVEDFMAKLDAGSVTISMGVMSFLRNWLTSHIQKTDKQYTPTLAAKKIA